MGIAAAGVCQEEFPIAARRQRGPAVVILGLPADSDNGLDGPTRSSLRAERAGDGTGRKEISTSQDEASADQFDCILLFRTPEARGQFGHTSAPVARLIAYFP